MGISELSYQFFLEHLLFGLHCVFTVFTLIVDGTEAMLKKKKGGVMTIMKCLNYLLSVLVVLCELMKWAVTSVS